jgi:dTDP-4-dehydrorhamnose reductase
LIINAAAYTAVDKAETEVDLAYAINAKAPEVMAMYAKQHGATFCITRLTMCLMAVRKPPI